MTDQRTAGRRSDTHNPHQSRERALKVLFDADIRGQRPADALTRITGDRDALALLDEHDEPDPTETPTGHVPRPSRTTPFDEFSLRLVRGVDDHLTEIDALIGRFARRWTVARMPVVDRNVLRLAVYELVHEATPHAIVIDEALTFAKSLSTDDSGRYVNGVLESVRRSLDPGDESGASPGT